MSDQPSVEERLAALEREVLQLKFLQRMAEPKENWLDQVAGCMDPDTTVIDFILEQVFAARNMRYVPPVAEDEVPHTDKRVVGG